MGAKGLFRVKAKANGKESVGVGGVSNAIKRLSRRDYEAFGYYPHFEHLPTKDAYEAQNTRNKDLLPCDAPGEGAGGNLMDG